MRAPWVLFELGALSKHVETTLVCTYLIGVPKSELTSPVSIFQATDSASKDDTFAMVQTLNAALGDKAVPETTLDSVFGALWPRLEVALGKLPGEAPTEPKRKLEDMVEETLLTVRRIESRAGGVSLTTSQAIQRDWLARVARAMKALEAAPAGPSRASTPQQQALESLLANWTATPTETENFSTILAGYRRAVGGKVPPGKTRK